MALRPLLLQQMSLRVRHSWCLLKRMSHSSTIHVSRPVSLFDEEIILHLDGLHPNTLVTMQAKTFVTVRKSPLQFSSCCHYVTSDTGTLDLRQSPSVSGTYTGVDSMGLFWSMVPDPSGPPNIRLVLRYADQPLVYTLSVYAGHISLNDLMCSKSLHQPLCETKVTRLFKAEGVKRETIKEDGVRGTLFTPPGEGPFPGIIDIYAIVGGLVESRGALLASRGFSVLCLPYFAYDDLPASYEDVAFDYFENAAKWMSQHKSVTRGGIGVLGSCGGAVAGSLMTWKCPQVVAFAQINGPPFQSLYDIHHRGKLLLQGAMFDLSSNSDAGGPMSVKDKLMYKPEHFIPVWETSTPILSIVSEDDHIIHPKLADVLLSKYPVDKRHLLQIVRYPGAGHVLDPPYTPHSPTGYISKHNAVLRFGGTTKGNSDAQIRKIYGSRH